MEPMKGQRSPKKIGVKRKLARASFVFAIIAGTIFLVSPSPRADTFLSLGYDNGNLFGTLELEAFGLGASRFEGGSLGLGLSIKDLEVGLDKWKLSPFFFGGYSVSRGLIPEHTFGGVSLEYFDYQIGGYLISVDSTLWANLNDYGAVGEGSFSIGNIDLSLGLRLGTTAPSLHRRWYPRIDYSNWQELISGSYPARSLSNHILLSGGERLFPDEIGVKWSQGLLFNLEERHNYLRLVEEVSWKGNRLSAIINNLRVEKLLAYINLDPLGAGFVGSFKEPSRYGFKLDYDSDIYYGLEVTTPVDEFELRVNFLTRW